jgi:putative N6-adenine-specific DNA methylase
LFWDPFCGSGTIPVEAAMMMKNIAPGAGRSFLGEDFLDLPQKIWKEAREEAADLRKKTDFQAFASDLDPAMVEIARENARNAGVDDCIRFFPKNALGIETGGKKGTIVCNPPYGERLESTARAHELYSAMGAHWKRLDRWQIYVITSDEEFQRHYGRKADKVRKLYNGMLKCFYYQFYKPQDLPRGFDEKKQNRFNKEKKK